MLLSVLVLTPSIGQFRCILLCALAFFIRLPGLAVCCIALSDVPVLKILTFIFTSLEFHFFYQFVRAFFLPFPRILLLHLLLQIGAHRLFGVGLRFD